MAIPRINSNTGTFLGRPITEYYSGDTPVVGSMYFDDHNHEYMVYTGSNWMNVANMSSDFFVPSRINAEEEILLLTNPGLAELKQQAEEAEEKYRAYLALCKE